MFPVGGLEQSPQTFVLECPDSPLFIEGHVHIVQCSKPDVMTLSAVVCAILMLISVVQPPLEERVAPMYLSLLTPLSRSLFMDISTLLSLMTMTCQHWSPVHMRLSCLSLCW